MSRLHRARCDPTRLPNAALANANAYRALRSLPCARVTTIGAQASALLDNVAVLTAKRRRHVGLHEALVPGVCSAAATHRVRRRVACA